MRYLFILYVVLNVQRLFAINYSTEAIEYKDSIITSDTAKYLKEGHIMLDEVVVKSSTRKRQIDRMLIYPSKRNKETTNSAWEVIKKLHLPKTIISKEGMSVTTSNNKSVIFKINGIPATSEEYLSISPDQIKAVEYYDNPGIRYEKQNIGGIINIKTKDYIDGYSLGVKTMDALTTTSTENNLHFKVNYQKDNQQYNKKFWNYYVTTTLNVTKKWSFDLACINNRREYSGNEYIVQESALYLSSTYSLKKLIFTLGIWNPFRNTIKLSESKYYNNDFAKATTFWNSDKGNMIYVQASFNLNKGKKTSTQGKKIQNYDNKDGIIR